MHQVHAWFIWEKIAFGINGCFYSKVRIFEKSCSLSGINRSTKLIWLNVLGLKLITGYKMGNFMFSVLRASLILGPWKSFWFFIVNSEIKSIKTKSNRFTWCYNYNNKKIQKVKVEQRNSNPQPLSSQTNTQPFSQAGQMIELWNSYVTWY